MTQETSAVKDYATLLKEGFVIDPVNRSAGSGWADELEALAKRDGLRVGTTLVYDGYFSVDVVLLLPREGEWPPEIRDVEIPRYSRSDDHFRAAAEAEWGEVLVAARARVLRSVSGRHGPKR